MITPFLLFNRKATAQVGRINVWQNAQTELIHAAGYEESKWVNYSTFGAGQTAIFPKLAFRQIGKLKKIIIKCQGDGVQIYKVKIFRWNAATSLYDFISECPFVSPNVGTPTTQTITLSIPLDVQIGDVPGIFTPASYCMLSSDTSTSLLRWSAGDISTSNAFATNANRTIQVEFLCNLPYLAVTGDSIPEGHNIGGTDATRSHGGLHTGTAGTATLPWKVSNAEIPANILSILKYQNLALGSATMDWVRSTGIVECLAVKPNTVLIHSGVNDVAGTIAWADTEADLDAILVAVNAASPVPDLLIDEILPWTAGSDAQAATIRTFNANLAAWCATNSVTLVLCHDAMGQIRVATGELDDLLAAYDQDGVHLTQAGVYALAGIWKNYI